jgi:hypothetical protein
VSKLKRYWTIEIPWRYWVVVVCGVAPDSTEGFVVGHVIVVMGC